MADQRIKPRDLPAATSVPNDSAIIIDDGVTVKKATPIQVVTSGRPLASQAEAEAGVEATKSMTPLTTKQAIAAQGAVIFATAAQGALADSAVQPGDIGTAAAEDVGYFATAAQGALADTSVQPADLGTLAAKDQAAVPTDLDATGTPSASTYLRGDGAWATPPGVGDMEVAVYDPNAIGQNVFGFLRGYLFGLTLANGVDAEHDIVISVGAAASDDTVPVNMELTSILTKQADATFAAGTAAGGMVSGESLPTSGTVHTWLIAKADGTTDVCFNNHASSGLSPTLPTDFVYKRRIGSLRTDSSANIRGFVQTGDEFMLKTPVQDSTTGALGTSTSTITLSVPAGLSVEAIGTGFTFNAAANSPIRVFFPSLNDAAVTGVYLTNNSPAAGVPATFGIMRVRTSGGQLYVRASAASTSFTWNTLGWVDTRGRLA